MAACCPEHQVHPLYEITRVCPSSTELAVQVLSFLKGPAYLVFWCVFEGHMYTNQDFAILAKATLLNKDLRYRQELSPTPPLEGGRSLEIFKYPPGSCLSIFFVLQSLNVCANSYPTACVSDFDELLKLCTQAW